MTAAFIVQCFIILIVPYVIWRVGRLRRVLLCVIVQILAGVLLGPTLLGRVAPGAYDWLFHGNDFRGLTAIATLALLIFSFTTGLHLDFASIRQSGPVVLSVGAAGIIVPSALGAAAGYWLIQKYPQEIGTDANAFVIALAIGVCCGVTALPVLAAILRELGLVGARLGQLALAIAALSDGALWLMVTPLLSAGGAAQKQLTFQAVSKPLIFVIAIPLLIGPILRRFLRKMALSDQDTLVAALAVAIGSAALTEAAGLHYILGAFLGGAIMPQSLRASLLDRLETPALLLLMPFFFALAGLKTKIDLLSAAFLPGFLLLTAAAFFGKVGSTMLFGRLFGEGWRHSLALGVLLQSKGLTEVVLVTILLEAGLVSPAVFSILIAMGIFCTIITAPLIRWLGEDGKQGLLFEEIQLLGKTDRARR
jgi:Kef-type K+ transport system membrane component KefB